MTQIKKLSSLPHTSCFTSDKVTLLPLERPKFIGLVMEFGFKEILFGFAGVSMIAWVAIIGLWHTYMFPRFFKEDSNQNNVNSSSPSISSAGSNSTQGMPWFVNDQGMTLNPDKALTATGLNDRGKYSKRSFVVADFNPVDSSYSVNRLYTSVLIGLAISTFVIITYGLQSGYGMIGVTL